MPVRTDTHLLDFGIGFLMGLVRARQTTLDERRLVDTHEAVVAAFQVFEAEVPKEHLRFWMTTHQIHRTSSDVDAIFNYWLSSGYATKDAPGTIYRFRVSRSIADRTLETLDGGAELYDKVAQAYFDYMNSHYTS